jgi:hypothetical protein
MTRVTGAIRSGDLINASDANEMRKRIASVIPRQTMNLSSIWM